MIWNVTVPILVVAVIVLLWRVWRLESKMEFYSEHYRKRCDLNAGRMCNVPTTDQVEALDWLVQCNVDECSSRLTALARALGYEWKRTEAKEGWEKKIGPLEVDWEAARERWNNLDADDLGYEVFGIDRRKGERRKPAPKKKPRRGKS